MSHSPEPWKTGDHCYTDRGGETGGVAVIASNGDLVAVVPSTGEEYCKAKSLPPDFETAERIVACVNFCAWIPTDELVRKTERASKGKCNCQYPMAPFSTLKDGEIVFICRGCGGET